MDSPVEQYLAALRHELRRNPLLARRVIEEVRDHLTDIVADEMSRGLSRNEAEMKAVERFGPAGVLARQFDHFAVPLKFLFFGSAFATIAVALWLISVIRWVLPARDPSHIPLWTGVSAGYLVYSGLSLLYIVRGPRDVLLRYTVFALSVAAFAAAIVGAVAYVRPAGGHSEGYLLLMALLLAGHAAVALAYTALTSAIAHRIAAK